MSAPWLPSPDRPGFDALGFDPAPGQLGNIDTLATQFDEVARSLGEANEALTNIGRTGGVWQGDAASGFQEQISDLPEYLDKATRSLGDAASALQGWHADLAAMQGIAADLEQQAKVALRQVEQAQANPDLGLGNQWFGDEETLREAQRRLDAAVERLRSAQRELEVIRDAARRLLEQHDELANRIAEALRHAKDIAPEEPGMFSRIGGAIMGGLQAVADGLSILGEYAGNIIANIADVIGDISTMLSVVSGIVELIPVVGTVVGTALDAVGLGLGVLALGGHLAGDALGADIPPETYALDVLAIGFSTASLVTPLPGLGLGLSIGYIGGQGVAEGLTGGDANTFFDNLGQYWAPRNPAQVGLSIISPAGTAFWNAIDDGIQETNEARAARGE